MHAKHSTDAKKLHNSFLGHAPTCELAAKMGDKFVQLYSNQTKPRIFINLKLFTYPMNHYQLCIKVQKSQMGEEKGLKSIELFKGFEPIAGLNKKVKLRVKINRTFQGL